MKAEKVLSLCIIILFISSTILTLNTLKFKNKVQEFGQKIIILEGELSICKKNRYNLFTEFLKKSHILDKNLISISNNNLDIMLITISDMSCKACVEQKIFFAEKYKNNYKIVLITSKAYIRATNHMID